MLRIMMTIILQYILLDYYTLYNIWSCIIFDIPNSYSDCSAIRSLVRFNSTVRFMEPSDWNGMERSWNLKPCHDNPNFVKCGEHPIKYDNPLKKSAERIDKQWWRIWTFTLNMHNIKTTNIKKIFEHSYKSTKRNYNQS